MPRKKIVLSSEHIELLKQETYIIYGKTINRSFECELMATQIKKSTGEYLSPQSLRRFFGFLHTPFAPAINTLNILSRYCGYSDWDNFNETAAKKSFKPLSSKEEIQLYLDFYKLELHDEQDINYHNASRIISGRILQNQQLFESLIKPLAENPVSQVYFFERFPFIDGLCSGYDRGIKLYLQHKKDREAQIFGYSLLILGAFLSQNRKAIESAFKEIDKYALQKEWHPFIIARYIGSKLLYYFTIKNETEKISWLRKAKEYDNIFSSSSKIGFWKFPYYQFLICDYLNMVREHAFAYELIYFMKGLSRKDTQVEDGYYDALCVTARVAASLSNRTIREVEQWALPDFKKPGVIFKKYYTIWFLISNEYKIFPGKKRKKEKIQQEIKLLIRQTGFTYFNRLL